MVYLFKGSFWLTIDEVVGGIIGFLLAIAFANYVTKDVYGTYRFLLAGFWTLTAFTMTGLPTAISRAIAQGREGAYRSGFKHSILWGTPLTVVALGTSGYYFIQQNSFLGFGFVIIAALGPLVQAAYLWSTYPVGKKQFRTLALCGVVFSLVPAVSLFITMHLSTDPLWFLFVYLFSTVTTGLLIALYILVRNKPVKTKDVEYRALGNHFSAMNLLATVAQQVDKIVVFHFLGATELAVYAFATALPEQIKNVFGAVSTLALPKFVERPFREIRANFWKRLWLYTGLLVIVTAGYVVVAPLAFSIFFPAYRDAIFLSQLYALSLIPIGNSLTVTLLQAHTAKRELYIYNLFGPLFQIIALIVLTSMYGLVGAIIARVLARFFTLLLGALLVQVFALRMSLAK